MPDFEMTPEEEAKYDHLDSTGRLSSLEIRQQILAERGRTVGRQATAAAVARPEKKASNGRHSRPGGRYQEHSDSSLDPDWNYSITSAQRIVDPEADTEFEKFRDGARADAITGIAREEGRTPIQADAVYKARKETRKR